MTASDTQIDTGTDPKTDKQAPQITGLEEENTVQDNPIYSATYSVEDNKLRLYATERLEDDLYQRLRAAGFKYAHRQELFVSPMWTPAREDLCVELAGQIDAEEMSLVERAENKAARYDELAGKREQQSNAYRNTADSISERFAFGQPILVGHHSEGKARRDQQKIQNAMDNARKAVDAVNYWNRKAEGSEYHANHKANPRTRANRIKKLLADLRDRQRNINHAEKAFKLWEEIDGLKGSEEYAKTVEYWAGASNFAPYISGSSVWDQLRDNKISHDEAVETCIKYWDFVMQSPYNLRWVSHILNRLGYERSELGEIQRFEGEITPVILQAFARENGAEKPKASKTGTGFKLVSAVSLPLHIAEGAEIEWTENQWRDAMQSVGYEVSAPKARRKSTKVSVPLINPTPEEASRLLALWNKKAIARHEATSFGGLKCREIKEVNQKTFSANSGGDYDVFKTIELDADGNKIWSSYKGKSAEPVCRVRSHHMDAGTYAPCGLVVLTDKPKKPLPIDWTAAEETAAATAEEA